MLEILLLIFLTRNIGNIAVNKGLTPGPWKVRLVAFWILAEITGAVIGLMLFGYDNIISAALVGLGCAFGVYFILKNYLQKMPDTFNEDDFGKN